jgi:hypothetical protein
LYRVNTVISKYIFTIVFIFLKFLSIDEVNNLFFVKFKYAYATAEIAYTYNRSITMVNIKILT